jgi:hypothetical protein
VSTFRIGLVLVLAVAAAVVANVVLLNVATGSNDPVGKLSSHAGLVRLPATTSSPTPSTPSPVTTTTPSDDGRSRGRGQDD